MAYQEINAILQQSNAGLSAAEAHGMATGMLCVNAQTLDDYWLGELFQNSGLATDDNKILLVKLFEKTKEVLASDEFEFDLFLPDDDNPLSEQAVALKSWCQGFLFGVGSAHVPARVSEDVREILKDISEFTRLDTEVAGDEDESAFIEVCEYLRSAVLLLRDELSSNIKMRVH